MKKSNITKAIITAAGTGTRFIPATKNTPKEMLPLIDKPIIHYLVEECVNSGIEDIILVTRSGANTLEDYFDNNYSLEYILEKGNKDKYLKIIREIPQMANFIYVRQKSNLPYGNGSPLLAAEHLIEEGESVVYMFGDDLTIAKTPVTKQLINVFNEQDACVVEAVQEVPWEDVDRYGTVEYKKDADYEYEMSKVLEKMPRDKAPSNMAQFGRFVLSYKVVEQAKKQALGIGNELWLTDMINELAQQGEKAIAQPIEGEWLTTGDPIRYMKAMLKFAYLRDDMRDELDKFIKTEILKR